MENTLYFDHAATTPMHPDVIQAMTVAMEQHYGNASSIYELGRESKGLLEEARLVLAKSINAHPKEIIFTSGGTESDNIAILQTAEKLKEQGKHIITTSIEHPAVREPLMYLERNGFDVTFLSVNKDGCVTVEQVKEAIREDTILVSIIYGNNEIGSIMPIQEIGEMLASQERKIVFHTDAVQAYGTETIDVKDQHIDLLSVSSHKINGPKGIGFIYINQSLALPGLLRGGEQENKKRAGTENIPAIVGFKKAVEIRQEEKEKNRTLYSELKKKTLQSLNDYGIPYEVNGSIDNSLPHILSLRFPGVPADKLLIHLDLAHIAVSIGSACSAGNVDPSLVLTALYDENHPAITETIRVSFGMNNHTEQIEELVKNIKKAVAFLSQN